MNRFRYLMFVMTVIAVLALSAMNAAPALADDSAPPPPDTPSVETPPADETTTEAPAVIEEPVSVEAPAVVTDPAPAQNEATVAEALASVPEGTDVVVIDDSGKPVSLATQQAENALSEGDPMWCPAGVAPFGAGCTISYTSLQLLVADVGIGFVPAKNGVIWIENNVNFPSAGPILFDGTPPSGVWDTWSNFSLTFKGGWTGLGSTITSTPSVIHDSLSIIGWNGDITLSDIVITNVSVGDVNNNAALNIVTTKKITLTNVDVTQNTGAGMVHGAYLDNSDGAIASDVVINNSTFTDNKDIGLYLLSDGAITISNLVVNSNGGLGALLDNHFGSNTKGITLTGNSNQFKFNGADGLTAVSYGAITMSSITVTNNGGWGAALINTGGTAAGITLTGTNKFLENYSSGLEIYSDGIVTLSNVAASDNGVTGYNYGYGLKVDNSTATMPKAVTLTGTNEFYNNYNDGLSVISDGAITVSNLTASFNQNGRGVYLENNHNTLSPQNVTLTGTTNVNNNGSDTGLSINTYGAVMIGSINANGNGLFGIDINNTGGPVKPVTINGAFFNAMYNQDTGIRIYSLGVITLNNVQANNNGYNGAYLDNSAGTPAVGVMINGTSSFSYNGYNGLNIQTKGNIVVKDFDADGNNSTEGSNGLYLDNWQSGAGTGNVTLGTTRANWYNSVSGNYDSGIQIFSNGIVSLYNITADNNGNPAAPISPEGSGLRIVNGTSSTPKAVNLFGENDFSGNLDDGLNINSKGAVTLNKITANDNSNGYGVYVANNFNNLVPQNVTLLGYGDFSGNGSDGLVIHTFGNILLNSVYSNSNNGNGVYVDNASAATLAKPVTINGYASVYSNNGDGLYVLSLGAITIANLDASFNNYGATLDNSPSTTHAPVTITGGAFTSNNSIGYGMAVTSKGAITINVVDAWVGNNATFGWNLDNHLPGSVGGVTLTPSAANNIDFSSNGTYGLWIQSLGSIKITNLDVYDSSNGNGATLDNAFTGSVGTVTVTTPTGVNAFNGNSGNGLVVYSNRAITLNNLYAESNSGTGVYLDNSLSGVSSPQSVTILGSGTFLSNGDNGLSVFSYGLITTNNLTANDNGQNADTVTPTGWGVILDNCHINGPSCDSQTAKGITLNGINTFNGNFQDGLDVVTPGAIKANQLTAISNGGNGAYLDNQWGAGFFGITLTGTNVLESNGSSGMDIFSNGVVTLSNVSANWNISGDGLYIDAVNTSDGPPNVTLSGTNTFLGNGATGLTILSTGIITLNNVTAKWNTDEGAYLDNYIFAPGYWTPVPANTISLTGTNVFSSNGATSNSDGLYLNTYGNISITKITADDNGGSGVDAYSEFGNIAITCGSMTNNVSYGWFLDTIGTATLKGVFATGNLAGNSVLLSGTLVQTRTCPLP